MIVVSRKLIAMNTEYGLHISSEVEKRILRCRSTVRGAIRERLRQIAIGAGRARQRAKAVVPKEPPLRFYVYEGYRIVYQLDAHSRRVVVLDIQLLPVD
jgi:mRNA-degrading endonuclease RelE of RelBE toxin-antitoxin system